MKQKEADAIKDKMYTNRFTWRGIQAVSIDLMATFINSLVSEDDFLGSLTDIHLGMDWCDCPTCEKLYSQIAKRMIEEYIEKGLPIKYNKGAPRGWERGIAYKYEIEILQDCTDWLDKEGE